MLEYLTHVVGLQAGPDGGTTAFLNNFAQDGWRLRASHLVQARASVITEPGQTAGPGLLLILERGAPDWLEGVAAPLRQPTVSNAYGIYAGDPPPLPPHLLGGSVTTEDAPEADVDSGVRTALRDL